MCLNIPIDHVYWQSFMHALHHLSLAMQGECDMQAYKITDLTTKLNAMATQKEELDRRCNEAVKQCQQMEVYSASTAYQISMVHIYMLTKFVTCSELISYKQHFNVTVYYVPSNTYLVPMVGHLQQIQRRGSLDPLLGLIGVPAPDMTFIL